MSAPNMLAQTMPTYDSTNVFAKILRAELPCHRLYEDADALAFLDIMPRLPGHALVIPKAPCRNILDCPPEAFGGLMLAVQKVARAIKSATGADGITLLQSNEVAAEQVVFHLHIHIIPRFAGEPLAPYTGKMADGVELAAMAEKVRAMVG